MSIRYSCGRILLPVLCCAGAWAQQYTISTIAGSPGAPGFADGDALTVALLNSPGGLVFDKSGKLYIADPLNHRVRYLSNGTVGTFAGTGTQGFSGDGSAATTAELNSPEGLSIDSSGNIYIADTGNHVIRKVDTSGNISTVAGIAGNIGSSGDNGPATSAMLSKPGGVFVDSYNNIFIADTGNSEIRKVAGANIFCVLGCGGTGGTIDSPKGVVVDASGNLYITDSSKHRVVLYSNSTFTVLAGTGIPGFSGDGGPATSAQLYDPQGVMLDSAGYLYIADSFNSRIRKILKDGTIVTIAGNGGIGYSGDGGPATSAKLWFPRTLIADAKGNLYVSDTGNGDIRLLTPQAPVITAGGVANAASYAATLSPGSLASLFGNYLTNGTASGAAPLATSLAGASVMVNGVAAPILYASPNQINFQVPWQTQAGTATVTVSLGTSTTNTISVPVVAAAPGLFTSSGNAVAQNYPDYSLNTASNPIASGGYVQVYLTGIGAVAPAIANGILTPSTTIYNSTLGCTATIGGTTAQVIFAGLTPNFVGLAQVNVSVPAGLKSGANPMVVTCNNKASNSATLYVK